MMRLGAADPAEPGLRSAVESDSGSWQRKGLQDTERLDGSITLVSEPCRMAWACESNVVFLLSESSLVSIRLFFFGNPFVTCSPFNFLFNNDDEYENVVFKPMDEYNSDYLIPSSFFFGDAYPCYRKFRPVCTHGDGERAAVVVRLHSRGTCEGSRAR